MNLQSVSLQPTVELLPEQFSQILKDLEPWRYTQMVKEFAPAYAQEVARQEALKKTYKVGPELQARMGMGTTNIRYLINNGKLASITVGKNGKLVTEESVQEYFRKAAQHNSSLNP